MKRSSARARPRVTYAPTASKSSVWWVAGAATFVWTAAVLAFSFARFALPGDPRAVIDAAQSRLGFSDWLMIAAAIAGPAALIWVIAWLVRRSMELRDESRKLAKAAVLLADAAETAEKRAELMLPAPDSPGGELIAQGPGHLHREIERASHAMSALQSQMTTMETALAKQAAAFDNAAERAADQTRALTAGVGVLASERAAASSLLASSEVQDLGAELVTDSTSTDDGTVEAAAVDLAFEPETDVVRVRRKLLDAGQSAGWPKLVEDAPKDAGPQTSAAQGAPADDREKTAVKTPPLVVAHSNEPSTIDPFDDLGPSAPKAAVGAALGAGVAMGFGASRDEDSGSGPSVGAPTLVEPAPAPAVKAEDASHGLPKAEDLEFMARALDWKKFVRAANFPENENDTETLDALYEVLTDPQAAALLQSSEDTLATLADLDLYMEDFVPEMSPVSAWRGHLDDRRGVQRIDAPIEQSRITAKLSSDKSFAKLADRFVDRYRVVLKRLLDEGADDRLALELADSRTGRAYILVADALGKL